MFDPHAIAGLDSLDSPALLVFHEQLEANLEHLLAIAGSPARLRPHCKTHKLPQVIELELARGITRHKCATLREAHMLAEAGARDIVLAYPCVGPLADRVAAFRAARPGLRFAVLADAPEALPWLERTAAGGGEPLGVLVDLETGMGRTGCAIGPAAVELARRIAAGPALRFAGLHVYDGHIRDTDLAARRAAVAALWERVAALRGEMEAAGLAVQEILAGGTGTFPLYAELDDPALTLSPGTVLFHDAGYLHQFPDLPFQPAALVLTRVVSRPRTNRLTLDAGSKAVAADPPLERRLTLPAIPDARIVMQSEEHLVMETAEAARFALGTPLLGIPWHICPTTALHEFVQVIRGGTIAPPWPVTARNRRVDW